MTKPAQDPLSEERCAHLLKACSQAASESAKLLMRGYRSRPKATEKAARDLVTEFDRNSQTQIESILREAHPEVPIIAEEQQHAVAIPEGLAFVVDPLDGTTNFVHGHPFFAVAVGVMKDAKPIIGAVVAPALGLAYKGVCWAARESMRNESPCAVSATTDIRNALVATGFPPDRELSPWNNFASFIAVKKAVRGVRRCGAAALDICFVADGTYDGYWERRLLLWDSMAASAIALAAGATISALDGSAPIYENGHIVVANPHVHAALVALVNQANHDEPNDATRLAAS